MYYTIYKVTNQISGKFYIGAHKTKDLNDGYMGSGKYLKHAIEKHGAENFTKEILYVFDNPNEMYTKEAEIVNEDFLAEENTYNLKVGGFGGFDYINANVTDEQKKRRAILGRQAANETLKTKYGENWSVILSKLARAAVSPEKHKLACSDRAGARNGMFGKVHSDEAKEKMRQAHTGEKNSQLGTYWIYNPETGENKKMHKGGDVPAGWIKGRKIIVTQQE